MTKPTIPESRQMTDPNCSIHGVFAFKRMFTEEPECICPPAADRPVEGYSGPRWDDPSGGDVADIGENEEDSSRPVENSELREALALLERLAISALSTSNANGVVLRAGTAISRVTDALSRIEELFASKERSRVAAIRLGAEVAKERNEAQADRLTQPEAKRAHLLLSQYVAEPEDGTWWGLLRKLSRISEEGNPK